jgi:hypothetical protein
MLVLAAVGCPFDVHFVEETITIRVPAHGQAISGPERRILMMA